MFARPIAQLVQRQISDILPGSSPGSSRFGARYISYVEPPDGLVCGRGSGRSQLKSVRTVAGYVDTFNFRF